MPPRFQTVGFCAPLTVPEFVMICLSEALSEKLSEENNKVKVFLKERYGANYDASNSNVRSTRRSRARNKNKGTERVLALVSCEDEDGVRTQVEVTTNANEWIAQLNRSKPWLPCLYVWIPDHVDDLTIETMKTEWRKHRGITGRTKYGIELAREHKFAWFLSSRFRDKSLYPELQPFYEVAASGKVLVA